MKISRPHRLPHWLTQSGISQLGILFFFSIALSVGWAFYNVIPFYYSFYELEGQMEAQATKASVFTDAQISKELFRHIKKLEIPIDDPDQLKINRFEGKILIQLQYQEVLSIDLGEDRIYDLWVFPFDARVERDY